MKRHLAVSCRPEIDEQRRLLEHRLRRLLLLIGRSDPDRRWRRLLRWIVRVRCDYVIATRRVVAFGPPVVMTTSLQWVSRDGTPAGHLATLDIYSSPRLSLDGKRVAVVITGPTMAERDIWLVDVLRNAVSRLMFDPSAARFPAWAPGAFGFQPYFETGFPHGRSQFISTVASSWASIALSYMLPSSRVRTGRQLELSVHENLRSFRSSHASQAPASFQSRITVCGEIVSASAVSSTLKPPKRFSAGICVRDRSHRGPKQ